MNTNPRISVAIYGEEYLFSYEVIQDKLFRKISRSIYELKYELGLEASTKLKIFIPYYFYEILEKVRYHALALESPYDPTLMFEGIKIETGYEDKVIIAAPENTYASIKTIYKEISLADYRKSISE
ncbi:hypothetical protein NBRC110019_07630 [Neptunitalea chrysea]|uniref:Uncharacterized protein n=1 Tax=Neptunitalea chrysea TaxID=1647581 RepID=A0A9W6ETV5_9FLAO|nr:hypothetical protein [Neptunitalea chrysea]GLB51724.1 hypothetical protein NBRC110019_07630 [Neptunitalea chrysea]